MSFKPLIIQGGMGVNISSWHLARTVSMIGQLGTVSGVALQIIMARLLIYGDPCGHMRRALSHFPFPEIAKEVIEKYYLREVSIPNFHIRPSEDLIKLTVCANFAFVWLAKEGHENPVSINFLEKIAMPHIYAIFGAMLANVDYITMGAGVPRHVPDVIDAFCENRVAEYPIPVIDSKDPWVMKFDPTEIFGNQIPSLKKPGFIPIVASNTLASYFAKKFAGRIYGLAIEEPTAGGHNAPPRNKETGQYSDVDKVDYAKVAELGLPFWIGGSYAYPEKLREALSVGASGIQVGSIFALSNESGMDQVLKSSLRKAGYVGVLQVEADMRISPTGYPFEVAQVQGTMSDERVRSIMVRKCPHGALVDLVLGPNGIIVRRCASEPIDQFIRKGGMIEDTEGRGCICRGLVGTSGLGNPDEIPVVTLGKDLGFLKRLMNRPDDSYTAKDAINFLLGKK